jgi:hypothetical protein
MNSLNSAFEIKEIFTSFPFVHNLGFQVYSLHEEAKSEALWREDAGIPRVFSLRIILHLFHSYFHSQ